MLINTIDSLPKGSQLILHFAGILGCHFNSKIITNIMNKETISVELNLWHAIKKELIIQAPHKELNEFVFSHDKIQLACVNLFPFDKEETNVIIGRKLKSELDNKNDNDKKNSLFYHLNEGINRLTEPEKKN